MTYRLGIGTSLAVALIMETSMLRMVAMAVLGVVLYMLFLLFVHAGVPLARGWVGCTIARLYTRHGIPPPPALPLDLHRSRVEQQDGDVGTGTHTGWPRSA